MAVIVVVIANCAEMAAAVKRKLGNERTWWVCVDLNPGRKSRDSGCANHSVMIWRPGRIKQKLA